MTVAAKDTVGQVGFSKILILLSAVLKLWTRLAKQRLREQEESCNAYIEEELSLRNTSQRNYSSPTLEAVEALLLFGVLCSTYVPFPSPRKVCVVSQTQKP